ncbi:MAG: ankyrin repeat domain-containing protein [Magnetococcales bacterium]|nr:ankyrin repeat domain-containing protein [Magnetococcales bacterium]
MSGKSGTFPGFCNFLIWNYAGPPEPLGLVAVARPDVLELLIDHGLDVTERNAFGKTALMAAAQEGQEQAVELLLKAGAALNAVTEVDVSRLPSKLRHTFRTALMYAADQGNPAVMERLLERGADPTLPDSQGLRAIHYYLGEGPTPGREGNRDLALVERLSGIQPSATH